MPITHVSHFPSLIGSLVANMPDIALYPTSDGDYVLIFRSLDVAGDTWIAVNPVPLGVVSPEVVAKCIHLRPSVADESGAQLAPLSEADLAEFRALLGIESDESGEVA